MENAPGRARWTISTAPISSTRCPSAGLEAGRLGVEHDLTHGGLTPSSRGSGAKELDDLRSRRIEDSAGVDDDMRPATFLRS